MVSEDSESTKIWKEKGLIERDRRNKMMEAMEAYDKNVYWPARKSLIERCASIGHKWHFRDVNPVGYPIFDCNLCGATEIRKEE